MPPTCHKMDMVVFYNEVMTVDVFHPIGIGQGILKPILPPGNFLLTGTPHAMGSVRGFVIISAYEAAVFFQLELLSNQAAGLQ
jgi:hypothetical protein